MARMFGEGHVGGPATPRGCGVREDRCGSSSQEQAAASACRPATGDAGRRSRLCRRVAGRIRWPRRAAAAGRPAECAAHLREGPGAVRTAVLLPRPQDRDGVGVATLQRRHSAAEPEYLGRRQIAPALPLAATDHQDAALQPSPARDEVMQEPPEQRGEYGSDQARHRRPRELAPAECVQRSARACQDEQRQDRPGNTMDTPSLPDSSPVMPIGTRTGSSARTMQPRDVIVARSEPDRRCGHGELAPGWPRRCIIATMRRPLPARAERRRACRRPPNRRPAPGRPSTDHWSVLDQQSSSSARLWPLRAV